MDDFEPSFIVFNYTETGESEDFKKLRDFALSMCEKYKQHSVMIKYPNAAPTWENKDGKRVSKKLLKNIGKTIHPKNSSHLCKVKKTLKAKKDSSQIIELAK